MEQTTRLGIVLMLLFYLVAMFFMFDAIGDDININYTSTEQALGTDITFLGMSFSVGSSFLGNIVTGVSNMPLWFNTLFITIPAILLAVLTIMMFIPTIPSG